MNKIKEFWKSGAYGKVVIIISTLIIISICWLTTQQKSAEPSAPQTIPTSKISSSCQRASARQIDNIRSGVKDISASNDIASAWAVKSGDFDNVWFVAAQITGPGINAGDATGLWAISGDPNSPGLTYSVNSIAIEFSSWGDGTKTTAGLSQFDDGGQEALECAKNNP